MAQAAFNLGVNAAGTGITQNLGRAGTGINQSYAQYRDSAVQDLLSRGNAAAPNANTSSILGDMPIYLSPEQSSAFYDQMGFTPAGQREDLGGYNWWKGRGTDFDDKVSGGSGFWRDDVASGDINNLKQAFVKANAGLFDPYVAREQTNVGAGRMVNGSPIQRSYTNDSGENWENEITGYNQKWKADAPTYNQRVGYDNDKFALKTGVMGEVVPQFVQSALFDQGEAGVAFEDSALAPLARSLAETQYGGGYKAFDEAPVVDSIAQMAPSGPTTPISAPMAALLDQPQPVPQAPVPQPVNVPMPQVVQGQTAPQAAVPLPAQPINTPNQYPNSIATPINVPTEANVPISRPTLASDINSGPTPQTLSVPGPRPFDYVGQQVAAGGGGFANTPTQTFFNRVYGPQAPALAGPQPVTDAPAGPIVAPQLVANVAPQVSGIVHNAAQDAVAQAQGNMNFSGATDTIGLPDLGFDGSGAIGGLISDYNSPGLSAPGGDWTPNYDPLSSIGDAFGKTNLGSGLGFENPIGYGEGTGGNLLDVASLIPGPLGTIAGIVGSAGRVSAANKQIRNSEAGSVTNPGETGELGFWEGVKDYFGDPVTSQLTQKFADPVAYQNLGGDPSGAGQRIVKNPETGELSVVPDTVGQGTVYTDAEIFGTPSTETLMAPVQPSQPLSISDPGDGTGASLMPVSSETILPVSAPTAPQPPMTSSQIADLLSQFGFGQAIGMSGLGGATPMSGNTMTPGGIMSQLVTGGYSPHVAAPKFVPPTLQTYRGGFM